MSYFIEPHCVSAYVVDKSQKEPKYLLLRRCSKYLTGTWQMVTGGVHENEKAWQTALREIQEETGLAPSAFYSADAVETFYLKDRDKVAFVPVFVAFVEPSVLVKLSDSEHDAFEWVNFEMALEMLIFAEQRRILRHVHENFVIKDPHPFLSVESETV